MLMLKNPVSLNCNNDFCFVIVLCNINSTQRFMDDLIILTVVKMKKAKRNDVDGKEV